MTNYYAIIGLEIHTAVTVNNVTSCSLVETNKLLSEDTALNYLVLRHSCVEVILLCQQGPFRSKMLIALSAYLVRNIFEFAPSDSDVDRYVITVKSLDSVFNSRWEPRSPDRRSR
jgi:hypothetical protein